MFYYLYHKVSYYNILHNGELYVLHGKKIKLINYMYLFTYVYDIQYIYVVLGINVIGSFIGRGIAVIIYNKYYVIMLFDLVDLVGISMEKRH